MDVEHCCHLFPGELKGMVAAFPPPLVSKVGGMPPGPQHNHWGNALLPAASGRRVCTSPKELEAKLQHIVNKLQEDLQLAPSYRNAWC